MARGISLHVGLDQVDSYAYGGWDGTLAGPVGDARAMEAIARSEGYRSVVLLDRQATAARVLTAIRSAASALRPGDVFLLTFSGNGAQLAEADTPEQMPTGYDETWVCWDRQLLDDELHAALSTFARDVRIVVLSDACHTGTTTRALLSASPPVRTPDGARRAKIMPLAVSDADLARRGPGYAQLRTAARTELARAMARLRTLNRRQLELRKATGCLAARVVLLAACQDTQVAYDGPGQSAFTTALLRVWDDGRFTGSYSHLLAAIRHQLSSQTPGYLAVGQGDTAWESTRPFTVDVRHDLEPVEAAVAGVR
jgi:hypothetical protein